MPDEKKTYFTTVGITRDAWMVIRRLKHGKKMVFVSRAILAYAKRGGKAFLEKNKIT